MDMIFKKFKVSLSVPEGVILINKNDIVDKVELLAEQKDLCLCVLGDPVSKDICIVQALPKSDEGEEFGGLMMAIKDENESQGNKLVLGKKMSTFAGEPMDLQVYKNNKQYYVFVLTYLNGRLYQMACSCIEDFKRTAEFCCNILATLKFED